MRGGLDGLELYLSRPFSFFFHQFFFVYLFLKFLFFLASVLAELVFFIQEVNSIPCLYKLCGCIMGLSVVKWLALLVRFCCLGEVNKTEGAGDDGRGAGWLVALVLRPSAGQASRWPRALLYHKEPKRGTSMLGS